MSLSNFVVFFISALSHFPSANFTNTHTLQELQIRVKDIWCLQWIGATGNDKLIWLCFVDSSAKIPLPPMFFLIWFVCAELVEFFASFLLSKVCSLELKPGKKIAGNYKSLFMDFYFLPASPFLLMKRPHLMLIFSCPQPFWHLHYFCRSFFGLLDK